MYCHRFVVLLAKLCNILKFINAGPVGTAELAVGQARNEIVHFAEITRKGFSYVKRAIHATDEDEFEKSFCSAKENFVYE